jgi:hypothetical protein
MKQIGLQPSTTHEPSGKEAGQNVGHYVVAGSPFAVTFAKLPAQAA